MAGRYPNPHRVKIHCGYTVEEAARVLDVHRNTVRSWIKGGLPACVDQRPYLILGGDLAVFLRAKRTKNKRPCELWQFYCLTCRAPKTPAGKMVDCRAGSGGLGMLEGFCPECERMMYRRVNLAKLDQFRAYLDITMTKAESRLSERQAPFMNCDFTKATGEREKTSQFHRRAANAA